MGDPLFNFLSFNVVPTYPRGDTLQNFLIQCDIYSPNGEPLVKIVSANMAYKTPGENHLQNICWSMCQLFPQRGNHL